jgi:glucokinase
MAARLILALDYGGTKHTAAILAMGGRTWRAHERVYSPPGADGDYDRATMLKLSHDLLSRVEGQLATIGVSFGGPVDAAAGIVRLSHHVPGWENTRLRDQLQAEFDVPAAVDNDANVAALGEWTFGAGQGCTSLLYVTVSTGIGGGWVLGGHIYSGADGMAGEIGHIVVRPGGMECVCGKRGCLEAEASGPAIAKKMWQRLQAQETSEVLKTSEVWNSVTGESVAQAAQQGDALAQQVMEDAASLLGTGLGGAINLMNPERIVLGGGVTKSGESYWRIVRETACAHALPQMRIEIEPARLGDDAPLWGAVALGESLL